MSDSDCDLQIVSNASAFHASASTASEFSAVDLQRVPSIVKGKYFSLVKERSNPKGIIIGQCQFCLPKNIEIRGQLSSSSNFLSHLKRKHSMEFEEYCSEFGRNKQRLSASSVTNEETQKIAQDQFLMAVTRYFISAMIPLNLVENTYFRQIFINLGAADKINAIDRHTLERTINEHYTDHMCDIKHQLKTAEFVCTTAEIWSEKRRSFFRVTAHWISPNYKRKSAALALRRFAGVNSLNKINDLLHSIYAEFGLNSEQIVATMTHNGSNCVKALRMVGVKESVIAMDDEEDCWSSSSHHSSSDEEDIVEDSTPVGAVYMSHLLPRQIGCSAHTLHLCITVDIAHTINNNEVLSAIHTDVMQKCNALWKAAVKPKSAAIIEETIGHTLKRPNETRWKSLYESLEQILKIKHRMAELAQLLGITSVLNEIDFTYLEEHIKCIAPIAEALDILQGDNIFYGTLLPCLLSLRRKLTKLAESKWKFCEPISTCLRDTFQTRFQDYLNFTTPESDNAAVAALTHPQFRNKWFPCIDEYQRDRLMALLNQVIAEEMNANNECLINEPSTSSSYDDFFDFGDVIKQEAGNYSFKASEQVLLFLLEKDTGFNILQQYTEMKKVFLKYNTPLPSWTPAEKLYSYATMANSRNCNGLSSSMFQKRVILKANWKHWNEN